jgi:ABC-type transporter Mla subunit MlaD
LQLFFTYFIATWNYWSEIDNGLIPAEIYNKRAHISIKRIKTLHDSLNQAFMMRNRNLTETEFEKANTATTALAKRMGQIMALMNRRNQALAGLHFVGTKEKG